MYGLFIYASVVVGWSVFKVWYIIVLVKKRVMLFIAL
jgi:hypothetical protein